MNCSTCNVPGAKHELPGGKCARCWRLYWLAENDIVRSLEYNNALLERQRDAAIKAARRWKARAQEAEEDKE